MGILISFLNIIANMILYIHKSNHTQANENTAYDEISHHTVISESKNGFGDIGMEENIIAYGQVP